MRPDDAAQDLLAPLIREARNSPRLRYMPSPPFFRHGRAWTVPHFVFNGPAGCGEIVRLGLFGSIHGDEPEGAWTLVALLERLLADPSVAEGYQLHIYPVCNPTGFAAGTRLSSTGRDLNREFWRRSEELEVNWLEHELIIRRHHGLISLHTDDTANGMYAYVRGAIFAEALARPALAAAARELPADSRPVIDGFRNHGGVLHECFEGVLSAPSAALDVEPFEIILETPKTASRPTQVQAGLSAVSSIMEAYPGFLGYKAGI